ncbi:ribbon-helix-helix domain-containing protein [Anabaena sp. 4-3]|uniref:ribbon-helix-helix domain-containing protein n=1 Tax=Anabaena sp. 4-3 TaxID=1811979 RepID=UPI0009EDBD25|nr:ribbon-helix-helix protein, CopG family [Anabaena sp. 4-3]
MATRRPRVMFTCDDSTKKILEEWAEDEGRTLSNLVERIVEDAIANRPKKSKKQH